MFWVAAALMGLVTAGLLAVPLLRGRGADPDTESADLQVYRDQLRGVEADAERGLLNPQEAEDMRTEIARRLLAADKAGTATAARGPGPLAAVLVTGFVLIGGGAIYSFLGARGLPDQPLAQRVAENAAAYAARPSQAEYEAALDAAGRAPEMQITVDAQQVQLLDQLKDVLKTRPDDLRGHMLLVSNQARIGLWRDAAQTQVEVLRIKGDTAQAADHMDLAEYLILATGGYVSPEAEELLAEVLRRNPRDPRARYYSGSSALQAGRADLAYDLWVRLLSESPPQAPWAQTIQAQIGEVAVAAGRPVPSGPSQEDVAAAMEMSPEDRAEMIQGMVSGLADRLAEDGGPAEDWARLIRAYGVLGERAKADAAWEEAAQIFAGTPADLAIVRQAAQDAEVVQ